MSTIVVGVDGSAESEKAWQAVEAICVEAKSADLLAVGSPAAAGWRASSSDR